MADTNTRYVVEMPVGCPAKLFIPLYAAELRKKLASCLALHADRIPIKDQTREKYFIRITQGALSGMEVMVRKDFSLASNGLQVTVRARPYSKTEDVLMKIAQVFWALCAIPTFFLLIPIVRFIILSLFLAILLLAPLALTLQGLIWWGMSLAYSLLGNEFDRARCAALLGPLKEVPLPDPLVALRPAASGGRGKAMS